MKIWSSLVQDVGRKIVRDLSRRPITVFPFVFLNWQLLSQPDHNCSTSLFNCPRESEPILLLSPQRRLELVAFKQTLNPYNVFNVSFLTILYWLTFWECGCSVVGAEEIYEAKCHACFVIVFARLIVIVFYVVLTRASEFVHLTLSKS